MITGNSDIGVSIESGSNLNYVDRNLISGNPNSNVTIDLSNLNRVFGNRIGTDATGLKAYETPGNIGVVLRNQVANNRIGCVTDRPGTGLGSVIFGNRGTGVLLTERATQNLVAGNVIGSDANGQAALPKEIDVMIDGAGSNTIVRTTTRLRNLIAGNRSREVASNVPLAS